MDGDQRRLQRRPCAVIEPDRHPHHEASLKPTTRPSNALPLSLPAPPPPSHLYRTSQPVSIAHHPHHPQGAHRIAAHPHERYDVAYRRDVPYDVSEYQRYHRTTPSQMICQKVPYEYQNVPYARPSPVRYEPYPQVKDKYQHARYEYQYPYSEQFPSQSYLEYRKRADVPPPAPIPASAPAPIDEMQYYQMSHRPQPFYPTAKFQNAGQCSTLNPIDHKYMTHVPVHQTRIKQYAPSAYDLNTPDLKPTPDSSRIKSDYYNHYGAATTAYPNLRFSGDNYHISDYNAHSYNYARPANVHYQTDPYCPKPTDYRPSEKNYDAIDALNQRYYASKCASGNPLARIPLEFSPDVISPAESSASHESAPSNPCQPFQEDAGYVSQGSAVSGLSADYQIGFKRERQDRGHRRPCLNPDASIAPPTRMNNAKSQKSIEHSTLDVRKFLESWNEEYEDKTVETETTIPQIPPQPSRPLEIVTNQHLPKQLCILDRTIIPEHELKKYEHIQKITKLPDFIKDEEISNRNKKNDTVSQCRSKFDMKHEKFNQSTMKAPEPELFLNELIDVEAKISQSVIHKEVKCNFEIKPCSPTKLAAPQDSYRLEKNKAQIENYEIKRPDNNYSHKDFRLDFPNTVISHKSELFCDSGKNDNKVSSDSLPVINIEESPTGHMMNYKNSTISPIIPSTPHISSTASHIMSPINTNYKGSRNYQCDTIIPHGKVNVIKNTQHLEYKNIQNEKHNVQQHSLPQIPNGGQHFYNISQTTSSFKNKNIDNVYCHQRRNNNDYVNQNFYDRKPVNIDNGDAVKNNNISLDKSSRPFHANDEKLYPQYPQYVHKSNEKIDTSPCRYIKNNGNNEIIHHKSAEILSTNSNIKFNQDVINGRSVICRNRAFVENMRYKNDVNAQYPMVNNSNVQNYPQNYFNDENFKSCHFERSIVLVNNESANVNFPKKTITQISPEFQNPNNIYNENTRTSNIYSNSKQYPPTMDINQSNHVHKIENDKSFMKEINFPSIANEIYQKPSFETVKEMQPPINRGYEIPDSKIIKNHMYNTMLNSQNVRETAIVVAEKPSHQSNIYRTPFEMLQNKVEQIENNSVIIKRVEKPPTESVTSDILLKTSEFTTPPVSIEPNVVNSNENVNTDIPLKNLPTLDKNEDSSHMTEESNNIQETITLNNLQNLDPPSNNLSEKTNMETSQKHSTQNQQNESTEDVLIQEDENNINIEESPIVESCADKRNIDKNDEDNTENVELLNNSTTDIVTSLDKKLDEESKEKVFENISLIESQSDTSPPKINNDDSEKQVSDETGVSSSSSDTNSNSTSSSEETEDASQDPVYDELESISRDIKNSENINKISLEDENEKTEKEISASENNDDIFKTNNCLTFESISIEQHETFVNFEEENTNCFTGTLDDDDDDEYVIIRTDENLTYSIDENSENNLKVLLSPDTLEKSDSEDANGLEIGGCWIDDIACVETVVAEEPIIDDTERCISPKNLNNSSSDEDSNCSSNNCVNDNDDTMLKDTNSNFINNSKNNKTRYIDKNTARKNIFSSEENEHNSDSSDMTYYKVIGKPKVHEFKIKTKTEVKITDPKDRQNKKRISRKRYLEPSKDYKRISNEPSQKFKRLIKQNSNKPLNLKPRSPSPEIKSSDVDKNTNTEVASNNTRSLNRMSIPKKKVKPKFEDVLRNIEKVNMSWIKKNLKKNKNPSKSIPKMIIKRDEQGSHYTSTTSRKNVVKNKWQPQVRLRRSSSIEGLVNSK